MDSRNSLETCDVMLINPDRVDRVHSRMVSLETIERLADIFAVMSDATRLRVLEALSKEELCVCDLSSLLGLSQSSVSHHLRILRNLRLVRHRRAGKLVYYSLDDDHISKIFLQGLEHVQEESGVVNQREARQG